jgi:hypothetical protein
VRKDEDLRRRENVSLKFQSAEEATNPLGR